jgi:hypothetical protein
MTMLTIKLFTDSSDDALAGFPFEEDQYIDWQGEIDGVVVVTVDLGSYTDTTRAQEQFLDTCAAVSSYGVDA